MIYKYGDIIRLKEHTKPQMSLDAKTFFSLPDDENAEIRTYWGLSEDAFETDNMGYVYLKSEYAKRLVWGVDDVTRIYDDFGGVEYNRLNINVAFDPEGDVNCGAFCSFVNECDIDTVEHDDTNEKLKEIGLTLVDNHDLERGGIYVEITEIMSVSGTTNKKIYCADDAWAILLEGIFVHVGDYDNTDGIIDRTTDKTRNGIGVKIHDQMSECSGMLCMNDGSIIERMSMDNTEVLANFVVEVGQHVYLIPRKSEHLIELKIYPGTFVRNAYRICDIR